MTSEPERGGRQPGAGGSRSAAVEPAAADPAAVLADLPVPLWSALLPLFRRATADFARSELPSAVRPFLGWKPDRQLASRPRSAIAAAIAGEPRLRQAIGRLRAGDSAEGPDGVGGAVVDLVVAERWEDLLVMSTRAVDERAKQRGAAADAAATRSIRDAEEARRKLQHELRQARGERDALRARLAQDTRRAEVAEEERDDALRMLEQLRSQLAELEGELTAERRRGADRVERLRRRVAQAESRARIDEDRARQVADELADLSRRLDEVVGAPLRAPIADPAPASAETAAADEPVRDAGGPPVARPGRPCRMPPGLAGDSPQGVRALLRAPGMLLLVDGYNVTKDAAAAPGGDLDLQRRWLVRLCEAVGARFGCRAVVVFDGAEGVGSGGPASRSVRTVFSKQGETADDRIVAIVEQREDDRPVLVVTSDRELMGRVEEAAADVARSRVFLGAVTPRP